MFDTGSDDSKARRLLKAMPFTLPPPPPNLSSRLALRRLSPLLLLAAALIALAVFFLPDARSVAAAQEQTQARITSISTANYAYQQNDTWWPECDTVPVGGCSIGFRYFGIGDEILFTATFSAPVTATGTPSLVLDVGGTEKLATFKETRGGSLIFSLHRD